MSSKIKRIFHLKLGQYWANLNADERILRFKAFWHSSVDIITSNHKILVAVYSCQLTFGEKHMKLGKNASWKSETVIRETTTKNVGNANEILGKKRKARQLKLLGKNHQLEYP